MHTPTFTVLRYHILTVTLTCLLFPQIAWGVGIPFVQHFTKSVYQGGTQSWGFTQDKEDRLCVANNDGLLIFDGVNWQVFPLPNRTIARSVATFPNGQILIGGQNELGYFAPDSLGHLCFHDLLANTSLHFEDVWDIEVVNDLAYIRTEDYLLQYDGDTLALLEKGYFTFMGKVNEQIWVQKDAHLYCVSSPDQSPVALLPDMTVVELLNYQDSMRVVSSKQGLWTLQKGKLKAWDFFERSPAPPHRFQTAALLPNDAIAFGTTFTGIWVYDGQGVVRYHLNQQAGLQANQVFALYLDHQQNLWAGLNYGIDHILSHKAFDRVYPDGDLQGTAYAMVYHRDMLYCGTSTGLYATPWKQHMQDATAHKWTFVPGTAGQVLGLKVIHNRLWMGHNEGAFEIVGTEANYLKGTKGVWTFLELAGRPHSLMAGTYNGLVLIDIQSTTPQAIPLSGLSISSRFLVGGPPGTLWVSHPYLGVYKVEYADAHTRLQTTHYTTANGLPSDLLNHAFSIAGQLVVASESGVFQYHEATDAFVPHEAFGDIFPSDQRIIRLQEDQQGNIWYAAEGEIGVIHVKDMGLTKEIDRMALPFVRDKLVGGYELIYPLDGQHVFFGMEKGFLHYTVPQAADTTANWRGLIRSVHAIGKGDRLLFGGFTIGEQAIPTFDTHTDALRFICGATQFADYQHLNFRYRLLGLSSQWSEWTQLPLKEYTNLSAGKYTFEVEIRGLEQKQARTVQYPFEIAAPWYATIGAYIVYGILLLTGIISLVVVPQRQFRQEKEALETQHQQIREMDQQEIAKSKAEIDSLRHDKLESEVKHKSQQLATATMHLVQKNEVIAHLRTEIEQLLSNYPKHPGAEALKQIQRKLNHDQQFDADWEQFAYHFDQVHAGFLRRLAADYPQLTPKDQRLCAYLRMNLATKEIAPLMNISVRGVEISRYRLRKKLELDRDTNLNEFMMGY